MIQDSFTYRWDFDKLQILNIKQSYDLFDETLDKHLGEPFYKSEYDFQDYKSCLKSYQKNDLLVIFEKVMGVDRVEDSQITKGTTKITFASKKRTKLIDTIKSELVKKTTKIDN